MTTIAPDTHVADIATAHPATIRVFQQHQIDFCCGGRLPLADACASRGLDAAEIVTELEAATGERSEAADWTSSPLVDLIRHIQARYHEHLRAELPRLGEMLHKVVNRHGDRLGSVLLPLQEAFCTLEGDLLQHMLKEDIVLFPAIAALEASNGGGNGAQARRLAVITDVMEHEHEAAGDVLARMRELTSDFVPPEDACPTFRGLYHGLAELEKDMHVHVHLENNILFPRAVALG